MKQVRTFEIDPSDQEATRLADQLAAHLGQSGLGKVLITGGGRSGKSSFAEHLLADLNVDYVATAESRPDDPEWQQRINLHQERRPKNWTTVETIDLPGVLSQDSDRPVLIDCLGVWLTRTLDDLNAWEDTEAALPGLETKVEQLVSALETTQRTVVAVTNEVGMGLVPATQTNRFFRDQLGRLNQAVAAKCDAVYFCVSGVAIKIKG